MATKLQIILEAKDKASKVIQKFSGQVQGAGTKVGGLTGKLGKLKDGFGTMQAAAAAAGLVTVGRVTAEMVKLGIEIGRAETALIAMAGGADEAAATLEAVRSAAGGGIDNLTAMQNATRLLSMGLASNAEEAGKLTDIAVTLGATMGKGPTEAMEEFSLLLANQSILRLDTFGISGARVRERMNELSIEMEGASRETRFLAAVMEEADGKMTTLSEAGFEAVSSVDVLSASIENAKQGAATFLADGLVPWIDLLTKGRQTLVEHEAITRDTADTYEEYATEMQRANDASGPLIRDVPILTEQQWNMNKAVEQGRHVTDAWAAAMQNTAASTGEAATKMSQLVVSTQELTAARIGQEAMNSLNQALKDGFIDQDQYDQASREVMSTLLGMEPAMIDANFAMREINEGFANGQTDVEGYVAQMQSLNAELARAKQASPVEVEVQVTTSAGGQMAFQHGGAFTVGGTGGVDSQLVQFLASPGEEVSVRQPDVNNSRAVNIDQVNINNGQDQQGFERMLRRALQ